MKFRLTLLAAVLLLTLASCSQDDVNPDDTTDQIGVETTDLAYLDDPNHQLSADELRMLIVRDGKSWKNADFFDAKWRSYYLTRYIPQAVGEPSHVYGFSNFTLIEGMTVHAGVWSQAVGEFSTNLLVVEVSDGENLHLVSIEAYTHEPESLTLAEVAAIIENDARFSDIADYSEPKSAGNVTAYNLTKGDDMDFDFESRSEREYLRTNGKFTAVTDTDGSLYVADADGKRTLVSKANKNGDDLSGYRNPIFLRFDGDKLYYNLAYYEWSVLYRYDCLSGENERVELCSGIFAIVDGRLYSYSFGDYYDGGLYTLTDSGEVEVPIDGFDESHGNILHIDEESGELYRLSENGRETKFCRYRLDGASAMLIQTETLDTSLCSPRMILRDGDRIVIDTERIAGCDHYRFAVRLTDK